MHRHLKGLETVNCGINDQSISNSDSVSASNSILPSFINTDAEMKMEKVAAATSAASNITGSSFSTDLNSIQGEMQHPSGTEKAEKIASAPNLQENPINPNTESMKQERHSIEGAVQKIDYIVSSSNFHEKSASVTSNVESIQPEIHSAVMEKMETINTAPSFQQTIPITGSSSNVSVTLVGSSNSVAVCDNTEMVSDYSNLQEKCSVSVSSTLEQIQEGTNHDAVVKTEVQNMSESLPSTVSSRLELTHAETTAVEEQQKYAGNHVRLDSEDCNSSSNNSSLSSAIMTQSTECTEPSTVSTCTTTNSVPSNLQLSSSSSSSTFPSVSSSIPTSCQSLAADVLSESSSSPRPQMVDTTSTNQQRVSHSSLSPPSESQIPSDPAPTDSNQLNTSPAYSEKLNNLRTQSHQPIPNFVPLQESVKAKKESSSAVDVEHQKGENIEEGDSEFEDENSPLVSADAEDKDAPCKILTKYIFINQPVKKIKAKKKNKIGLLYTQAFRHFQNSNLSLSSLSSFAKKRAGTLATKKHNLKIRLKNEFIDLAKKSAKSISKIEKEKVSKTKAIKTKASTTKASKTKASKTKASMAKASTTKVSKARVSKTKEPEVKASTSKRKATKRKAEPSSYSDYGYTSKIIKIKEDVLDENEGGTNRSRRSSRKSATRVPISQLQDDDYDVDEDYNVDENDYDENNDNDDDDDKEFLISKSKPRKMRSRSTKRSGRRISSSDSGEPKRTKKKKTKSTRKSSKPAVYKTRKSGEKKVKREYKKRSAKNVASDTQLIIPFMKYEKMDNEEGEALGTEDAGDANDLTTVHPSSSSGGAYGHDPSRESKYRKEATLRQKIQIIRLLERPGAVINHVAKKFGMSRSSVSRINKNRGRYLSQTVNGEYCQELRRVRECRDPVLDKVLLKWYRAMESLSEDPISISNPLLMEKGKDIAVELGSSYTPNINWIIRWKYRHDIRSLAGRIESKETLQEWDSQINLAEIISEYQSEEQIRQTQLDMELKQEKGFPFGRQVKMTICEHCGEEVPEKKTKKSICKHLSTCPLAVQPPRRNLTLGERIKVAQTFEKKPKLKKTAVAKKFGVSRSVISRIFHNRQSILTRYSSSYINKARKRYRPSKEPEVEHALCDWYLQQQEYGYHVSSFKVREKAREIAKLMGKDFYPSESWVFRWRHRNNINPIGEGEEEMKPEEEEEEEEEEIEEKPVIDGTTGESGEGQVKVKRKRKKVKKTVEACGEGVEVKPRPRLKLAPSVMCEKCGCVSPRGKNNRLRAMKHILGCPDMRPRNEVTYVQRVEMLKALEVPGTTASAVARQYGVSASSVSRMNRRKEKILNRGEEYAGLKRVRPCKEPEVAKLLYQWFLENQQIGIHVTGVKLKEKAALLASEMGREFKASTGWIGRWKHRYNLITPPSEQEKQKKAMGPPKKKSIPKKKQTNMASIMPLPIKQEMTIMKGNDEGIGENVDSTSPPDIVSLPPVDNPLTIQNPRMVLNPHYPNPWTVNHQPTPSSLASHVVPNDNHHMAFSYDHLPRQVFHNVFENFSAAGAAPYSMSMVEAGVGVVQIRDYLSQEHQNDALGHQPGSSSSHSHPHPHHEIPPSLTHQHQAPLPSIPISHQPQHSIQSHQSSIASAVQVPVDDNSVSLQQQRQQIMDACRLMNSFAKEKSLGETVEAALRTIEMTLKGPTTDEKFNPRSTYTNI